jgi:hypothetical protein
MTAQFRNRQDTRRYSAAEDAFTSEGGYLAMKDDDLGKGIDTGREHPEPHRDFMGMVGRYATGMRHVLTVFRGSAQPSTRSANPPAR